jgi:hypothetical protein
LHLISDDEEPWGIVARLVDAVPSGRYLVVTHPDSMRRCRSRLYRGEYFYRGG